MLLGNEFVDNAYDNLGTIFPFPYSLSAGNMKGELATHSHCQTYTKGQRGGTCFIPPCITCLDII
jgi:hypothetical protein